MDSDERNKMISSEVEKGALLSPSQIASHLPSSNSDSSLHEHGYLMLDRSRRLLAAHSILTCSSSGRGSGGDSKSERVYGLAPVSKYFVRNQDGVSLSPLLYLIQDPVMIHMWDELKDAVVKGGLPFHRAHGMSAAEYVVKDERLGNIFKGSMIDYNTMFMHELLDSYARGFEGLTCVVDVGGGTGSVLNMIISRFPSIKGINFDLAPVIERAPPYSGIEHVIGDMFISIPKGDAIFMKWMLHSWDEEHCLKILKNCYEALPGNGKVMVVDLVVPEVPETSVADQSILQFDLFMMNMNPGGKERTIREFESFARGAGFSSIRVVFRAFNFSLLEFYKEI